MTDRIFFDPAAQREFDEAADFYDLESSGLGERFLGAVCVPLTSNLRLADAPGNVLLEGGTTGLKKDSVANISQPVTLDRTSRTEHVGSLPPAKLDLVLYGINIVLSR